METRLQHWTMLAGGKDVFSKLYDFSALGPFGKSLPGVKIQGQQWQTEGNFEASENYLDTANCD